MYQAYRLEIVRREKEMAETGKRQAVAASTGHGRDANSIKRTLIYEKKFQTRMRFFLKNIKLLVLSRILSQPRISLSGIIRITMIRITRQTLKRIMFFSTIPNSEIIS